MSIDIPLVISSLYLFFVSNTYGWGLFQDRTYIVFVVVIGILYLLTHGLTLLRKTTLALTIKIILLLLFTCVTVFAGSQSFMLLRQKTSVVGFINDSGLQTEIAGRYLLLGKNPYVENYVNTDLAKWKYKDDIGNTKNPALYSNVTPPFMIVASALGFKIFSRLLGWFDIRFILLPAYATLIILGFVKFGPKQNLLIFLILVCLQPLFLESMMQGSNDIVVVTLLLWGLYFLEKKKLLLSGIFLGLSIATKQTAWFIAPFYFIYLYQNNNTKHLRTFFTPYVLTAAAFFLPFIIWNFPALVSNIILYSSYHPLGTLPIHPVEGYGFSYLLYSLGYIHSIYAQYPFWIYQLIFGAIVLVTGVWLQIKKRFDLSYILYAATALTLVIWFFNRYFLVSHVAYILVMIAAAYTWMPQTEKHA
jgi:hypothetical protein